MAGKSSKGKNKGRANSTDNSVANSKVSDPPASKGDAASVVESSDNIANGVGGKDTVSHTKDAPATATKQQGGELHLYAVPVKGQSGEKVELQLSPGDSVMDIRQFLLDAPETCFFTCYDLVLHTKDGSVHHLEDYNEISEVADITTGGCSLEMIAALYDDRSMRAHVRRARDLLSLSHIHSSLSTLLALQHETSKLKAKEITTTDVKVEATELDGLGFMEDVTSSLGNLVIPSSNDNNCVENIVFSSFNPPPCYRRLVGDLIYVDVMTLEGTKYCITGTTQAFYVNASAGNVLDPRSAKLACESSTLIGLLQRLSPKFKKGFREILERKASVHPFENVQVLLPQNSWLGVYPVPDHQRDAARAEDALALTYGSELIGMQRDWNEELQSCREFSHNNLQERILRDRALYKVSCDFVDAAVNGAVGVINRCIPPINPADPECFHMYVHNNIFFSFAVDDDLGQIAKEHLMATSLNIQNTTDKIQDASPCDAEPKVSSYSSRQTSCDSIVSVNFKEVSKQRDCVGLATDAASGPQIAETSCDSIASVNFKEVNKQRDSVGLATDVASESQIAESEQATYASANNDLRGTKAFQEADVPGLYNLAMAIIDYRGFRVVAQSIIPGILQGDKSESLLYGSVDNGKKICWSESFHSKVLEAAKRLHLKEHAVFDGSGSVVKLAAPVECKGIMGSDDRHYLLDLMRITPRDANYAGPGSRFCILRPELVASFCQFEASGKPDSVPKGGGNDAEGFNCQTAASANAAEFGVVASAELVDESISPVDYCAQNELFLNPNVFTDFRLAGNQEEIAADEAIVKKAATYLLDVIVPKFVQDLCSLEVSPMDGQTLTDAFHSNGINMRYLGKIADLTRHIPHLWDICTNEIIVRSAKHILKDVLRETLDHDLASAISHFLNCLFGHVLPSSAKSFGYNQQSRNLKKDHEIHHLDRKPMKGQKQSSHKEYSKKGSLSYLVLTSEKLWVSIQEFTKFKYQFELPDDERLRVKKVSVLRNVCQKVNVTVASRKYNFDASAPFQTSDILNIQPVVKHSVPVCREARDLMDMGKTRLSEGMLNEAYTNFSEAFAILQQVTGPMHRGVATCCRYLAMVLYHAGDLAGAIMQQHKELIINERCLGLDHPDTAHSYGNMALFYHGLNQTEVALRHMSRTLLLLNLSSGPEHPDVAATFINVAMMYQDIGKMDTALRYLQEALKKNERLLGQDHIQTAVCYHALAIAFSYMGAYKLSLQHEKKTYDILVKQLGVDDPRIHDSESWINTFKLREQQLYAQKLKGQLSDPPTAQKAMDILRANPGLVHAFQAASRGSGNLSTVNKSITASMIGEAVPRGRGVNERAARAVAEARKKAAAKGLLVRPIGVPAQPLSPLTQLLNIINNGAVAADTTSTSELNEAKKADANETPSNGTVLGVTDMNGSISQENGSNGFIQNHVNAAPIGLGSGLSSLETKNKRSRPKPQG